MGMLNVVGIGPGAIEHMTILAYNTLRNSDVIVGYTGYTALIEKEFHDKEIISTGMGSEEERCRIALNIANSGKAVSLICSGDSVIYGMAGLVYELKNEYEEYENVEINVVPGVTAAVSGSALIGAGIGNDFAVISLSNYLTEKDDTYKRLKMCAEADLVMVFYNPSSRARKECLNDACKFLLQYIDGKRVCAVARNIGRDDESYTITTLEGLLNAETDMFSTVFIGSSMTENIDGHFVTRRGYRIDKN